MKTVIRVRDWLGRTFLDEGARVWNVSRRLMLGFYALPFLVCLAGVVAALLGKGAYKWFTDEDRFCENGQVLFWSLTFVSCFVMARRLWASGDKLVAMLYIGLSCCVFFLIGEEISWGQRIVGWGTPPEWGAMNKQDETNIHNVYGVGYTFKWVYLGIAAYGVFLPLLLSRLTSLGRLGKMAPLVVPHYTLLPYFLLPFLWKLYANLVDPPARFYFVVEKYSEVLELVLALGFFFFMIFQLRWRRELCSAGPRKPSSSQAAAMKALVTTAADTWRADGH